MTPSSLDPAAPGSPQPLPPKPNPGTDSLLRRALLVAALLLVTLTATLLYFHRPAGQFFYPRCSFYSITGWLCPGCGGMRALHELLHGNWLTAARCNALLVLGTPLFLLWFTLRRRLGLSPVIGARTVWIAFAIAIVFTILRNLPLRPASWLAP